MQINSQSDLEFFSDCWFESLIGGHAFESLFIEII